MGFLKHRKGYFRRRGRRGFTLIELMVVIVILGLLAGLVGPRVFKNVDKANMKTAKSQIELIGQGLDTFRLDAGRYPSSSEGLDSLQENPGIDGWDGPYLKKAIPKDPWGNPYLYRSPGEHGEYDIVSYGKDGTEGGDGYNADITSWE